MDIKLALAIFFMASGFLAPLGALFLVVWLWEDGVKVAISKDKETEQTYINGFDSNIVSDMK